MKINLHELSERIEAYLPERSDHHAPIGPLTKADHDRLVELRELFAGVPEDDGIDHRDYFGGPKPEGF